MVRGTCPARLVGTTDLGRFAFIRSGRLELATVASCEVKTLVTRGVEPPLRWSADGRFLAFGTGSVVGAAGGTPARPLGKLAAGWGSGSAGWVWSPSGHRLAGVSAGGVVIGGPGMKPQRLLPTGWGATSIAWSPDGRSLGVSRTIFSGVRRTHEQIWLVDLASRRARLICRVSAGKDAPPYLYGFSPDSRWLLAWQDVNGSASIAADGLPLLAVSTTGQAVPVGTGTLVYGDFLSWCADALTYVADRGGREVTLGDRIAMANRPDWKPVVVDGAAGNWSYSSPACSPPNTFEVAAAVGPTTQDSPFGQEHRRIWLLGYTGGNWHPLGPIPPRGQSDELPLWSADGRWIAFIRSGPTNQNAGAQGTLYLLDLGKQLNGHAQLVGPIASLGSTGNYYGHYNWAAQVAWYSR